MAWKNGELFKLKKQNGRCWQACFVWDKYHWISTHEMDENLAIKWAENFIIMQGKGDRRFETSLTLHEFAKDFFSKSDPKGYRKRMKLLGKEYSEKYYSVRNSHINNYIIPVLGKIKLTALSIIIIENWYIDLRNKKNNEQLSSGSKMHILKTLSIIIDEAIRLNLLPYNPCDKVERINVTYKTKKIFTQEMYDIMFPDNIFLMISIWDDVKTALYFSIAKDTGWRAGEILALNHSNWYENESGIYSTVSVSTGTGELKNTVKTSKKGCSERIGFLSDRSIALINMLPEKNRNGYFFSKNGEGFDFLRYYTLLFKMRRVLRDNVRIEDWDDYGIHNFRHTFMTRIKSEVSTEIMLKLMGHTSYRREYDHSSATQRLHEVESAREIVRSIV